MVERISKQIVNMVAGTALLLSAILFIATFQRTTLTAQSPDTVVEPAAPLAVSQVLNYQGRLLSPGTGLPKSDGDYQMAFSIYNVPTGGSPLWTETQSVPVNSGFFSALLGSVTALTPAAFNGQELFLGVTLAGDPEMTPRQRLAHIAYAMFAENAGTLDGINSTGFAAASHNHSGAAINSGTVAEARIDGAIARDSEIFPAVLAADGPGSGLNADLLDGINSSAIMMRSFGVQYSDTLASNAFHNVGTQEWSPNYHVLWTAVPTTVAGEVTVESVETVLMANGNYAYVVRVRNTGSVTTGYQLRYAIFQ